MIRNTKDAEDTLKNYETRLRDVNKVPAEESEVEAHRTQLKVFPLFENITVNIVISVVIVDACILYLRMH